MKKTILYILLLAAVATSCLKDEPVAVTGITLYPEALVLSAGETANLFATLIPENASERTVFWSSDDESVVTVNRGIVTALQTGTATIYVETLDGGYQASCPVKVLESGVAVDLGLSVKWAAMNIGADSPEQYGTYFAWGETQAKTTYNWENYVWGEKDEDAAPLYGMTGYTGSLESGDAHSTLMPEDDPATLKWGKKWRTPTYNEVKELFDGSKCEITWDNVNNGIIITGKSTHNSIYLPAAGRRDGENTLDAGKNCCYWTSTVYPTDPSYSRYFFFSNGQSFTDRMVRHMGLTVRAVTE